MPSRQRITPWLAVFAWGVVIFSMSTEPFGGEHTGAILIPILHALIPSATPAQLATMHQVIRKLAHFVEYLVLGLLLHRALRSRGRSTLRTALAAIAFAVVWASLDEASQLLERGRTAAVADVALDVSGTAVAQLLVVLAEPGRLFRTALPPRGVL